MKIHRKKTGLFSFFLIVVILLSACRNQVKTPETPPEPLHFETLLILPFKDMARVYGENVSVKCPLCDKIFMTGKVSEGADNLLTENLLLLMKKRSGFKLIPPGHASGVLSALLSENEKVLSERDILVETGRRIEVDAVMAGHIYRFRERIGRRYSVESPASVAFDIHLVDVATGRILWVGVFDETQCSLTENLFKIGTFLKRKGRWITAEEMAIQGLEDVLQTFPIQ
jgi:hypothetical protein